MIGPSSGLRVLLAFAIGTFTLLIAASLLPI